MNVPVSFIWFALSSVFICNRYRHGHTDIHVDRQTKRQTDRDLATLAPCCMSAVARSWCPWRQARCNEVLLSESVTSTLAPDRQTDTQRDTFTASCITADRPVLRSRSRSCLQGDPIKLAPFLYAVTLPNIDRFSKLFHCQNQEKICNNNITKDPTTPQVCGYTTL